MNAATDRSARTPFPPSLESWRAATADYDRGLVMLRTITSRTADQYAELYLTRTFAKQWAALECAEFERVAIVLACSNIAHDVIHPMMSVSAMDAPAVRREPLGARMASPVPGITVTWRPHWNDDAAPVMMTVERS